jgi:hypothetical protein
VTYITVPTETDPDAIAEEALDYLAANIPGYVPQDGHLEVWLIYALARVAAMVNDTASTVDSSIFRYYGSTVVGIQPVDAAYAYLATTWTTVDTLGYTIPAGTLVGLRAAGDDLVAFATAEDLVIPAESTTGSVTAYAVDPGAAGNGLGPGTMELIDALGFITSVTAPAASGGGVDAESDDAYLSRLATEMRLMSPRPILPQDFAVLARRVPGVVRSTAIDGYNPSNQTYNNQRMVAVAVVDAAGQPLNAAAKASVTAYLTSLRELNFVINVFDPTYTTINVTYSVVARSGYDQVALDAVIADAVRSYLDPSTWGIPADDPQGWINIPVVRYLELASLIDRIDGVDYVSTLTINGLSANLALVGAIPLPTPGTITGTVS